jgi:hypothetical protein
MYDDDNDDTNNTTFRSTTNTGRQYRWSTFCSTSQVQTSDSSSTTTTWSLTYCIDTEYTETTVNNVVTESTNACVVSIQDQPCASCVMGSCDGSTYAATTFDCTNVPYGRLGDFCQQDAVIDFTLPVAPAPVAMPVAPAPVAAPTAMTNNPAFSPTMDSVAPVVASFPDIPNVDDDDDDGTDTDFTSSELCEFYNQNTLGCDCSAISDVDGGMDGTTVMTNMNCVLQRSSCVAASASGNATSSTTTSTTQSVCYNETLDLGDDLDGSFAVRECYYLDNSTTEYCRVKMVTIPGSPTVEPTVTCALLVNGVTCNACVWDVCEGSDSDDKGVVNFDCSNTDAMTMGSVCNGDVIFPMLVTLEELPPTAPRTDTGGVVPVTTIPTVSVPTMPTTMTPVSSVGTVPSQAPVVAMTPTMPSSSLAPNSDGRAEPTASSEDPDQDAPTLAIQRPNADSSDEPEQSEEEEQQQQADNGSSSSASRIVWLPVLSILVAVVTVGMMC